MRRALSEYRIAGIKTSIPFHLEIMDSTEFIWGTFDTGFLSRRRIGMRNPIPTEHEQLAAVVSAMIAHEEGRQATVHIGATGADRGRHRRTGHGGSWRDGCVHKGGAGEILRTHRQQRIRNRDRRPGHSPGRRPVEVDIVQSGTPELYSVLFGGRSFEMFIEADRFNYTINLRSEQFQVQIEDERARRLNRGRKLPTLPDGELAITAPIPGLVVKVLVNEGDAIEENQPLVLLEAMKMENELRSHAQRRGQEHRRGAGAAGGAERGAAGLGMTEIKPGQERRRQDLVCRRRLIGGRRGSVAEIVAAPGQSTSGPAPPARHVPPGRPTRGAARPRRRPPRRSAGPSRRPAPGGVAPPG